MGAKALATAILLAAVALAGCSEDQPARPVPPGAAIPVTDDTGGIRGVVVDESITPLANVNITAIGEVTRSAMTDATGLYAIADLPPGSYIVKASHRFYDQVQRTVEVVAGVAAPEPTNFQLTRAVAGKPYFQTLAFDGYIVCSLGLGSAGYSEECGEGAGVPCDVPPPLGCQRVGGQPNNDIQFDFYLDSGSVKTMIVEQVWDSSTSGTGSGVLHTILATDWACDPSCGGKSLGEAEMESPLYLYVGKDLLEGRELTPDTRFSTFTVAGGEDASLTVSQQYRLFVTSFYYADVAEGWSFVAESPTPDGF